MQQNVIGRLTEPIEILQRNVLGKISESMEIEKSKFNLILHGIKESENGEYGDADLVNEMLRSVSIDPVRHVDVVSRVGRAAKNNVSVSVWLIIQYKAIVCELDLLDSQVIWSN